MTAPSTASSTAPDADRLRRPDLLAAVDDLLRRAGLPPLGADERALRDELAAAKLAASRPLQQSQLPTEFLCPITREVMDDPVIAADGFTYERRALERWLASHATSPQTNARLPSRLLVPNRALKALIEAHLQATNDLQLDPPPPPPHSR